MSYFLSIYFGIQLLIVILAAAGTIWFRRRRLAKRSNQPPSGFQRTAEIFIDPTTGIKQQVWFNPRTGERFYQTLES
ncbi:hypothetical protein A8990_13040 [Paenibacillus taihuensis]|uniref:Uncharacterized protein n=1 Tax=Paenibacillus taihuensis TaxID=1156355 RepID=A0A3D9QYB1_9BACL|nr:hypothetical protein [Paenibacillus taihuensis]REE70486.1 hypothetical protein A8990_13040 [Paenibacillus taihuensis]